MSSTQAPPPTHKQDGDSTGYLAPDEHTLSTKFPSLGHSSHIWVFIADTVVLSWKGKGPRSPSKCRKRNLNGLSLSADMQSYLRMCSVMMRFSGELSKASFCHPSTVLCTIGTNLSDPSTKLRGRCLTVHASLLRDATLVRDQHLDAEADHSA
jgi:hypothetical protein